MMKIDPSTLDFYLPEELIAQEPLDRRDQARMLVVHRKSGRIEHKIFSDLVAYVEKGDVIVINKAKVNHARVFGKKRTGGKVEVLFLGQSQNSNIWRALIRPPLKEGTDIVFDSRSSKIMGRTDEGEHLISCEFDPFQLMQEKGIVPLPPYIKRAISDLRASKDKEYYQTVYANTPGSVAAPTAGLHFTFELMSDLQARGVRIVEMVLHVGWGTFRPIAENVNQHKMLSERYEFSTEALGQISQARAEGRRLISVGTTATRALESLPEELPGHPIQDQTSLFISPGYHFKRVGALITNLHVPRSTPVSLTAAFAGMENLERAYSEAIHQKYRFYSYGDAMLVV